MGEVLGSNLRQKWVCGTTLLDILGNTDCTDTAHTTAPIDMGESKVGGVGGVRTVGVP